MSEGLMRWKPQPSTVISLVALFVALAGTSYATVAVNQVKSKHVVNNSLKAKDLKDGKAVGSADVINDSLTAADLAANAVTTAELANNAVNSAKIANNSINQGEIATAGVGADELTSISEVPNTSATVADGATTGVTATCPAGTQVISGGVNPGLNSLAWRVQRNSRDGNGWRAFGTNQTGVNSSITVFAYCLIL